MDGTCVRCGHTRWYHYPLRRYPSNLMAMARRGCVRCSGEGAVHPFDSGKREG